MPGRILPIQAHSSIDGDRVAPVPAQTFSATASTRARPPTIWKRLQAPETWNAVQGVDEVFDPQFDDGKLVGFKFHSTAAGRKYIGTATPGPREREKSLQWEIATSELKGWIRVELEPDGTATTIHVTMHVESVSFMASLGFPLITGAIASGFQETADQFARDLDAHESE